MVSEHTRPKAETGSPLDNLSERDLALGRKCARFMRIACMSAFLVCLGIALFVAFNVPLETRMPYEGKYGRGGIPMPIAMLPILVTLAGFWWTAKKPDAHIMGRGSSIAMFIFGAVLFVGGIAAQWFFARGILIEGGALAG